MPSRAESAGQGDADTQGSGTPRGDPARGSGWLPNRRDPPDLIDGRELALIPMPTTDVARAQEIWKEAQTEIDPRGSDRDVVKWGPGPPGDPNKTTMTKVGEAPWGPCPCSINDVTGPHYKTVFKFMPCYLGANYITALLMCPGCQGWFCREHLGQRVHMCHGRIFEEYNALSKVRAKGALGQVYLEVPPYSCPLVKIAKERGDQGKA